jgi:Azurin
MKTLAARLAFLPLGPLLMPAQNPSEAERLVGSPAALIAQEDRYYHRVSLPIPEHIALEVGGLLAVDNRLLVATRRGELWWVDGAYEEIPRPTYSRFASGLHEPLGLAAAPSGGYYLAQRTEITHVHDDNDDGRADRFETVLSLPVSGNFHEYAYGPAVAPDGKMRVTLNLAFGEGNPSPVPWRGWMLEAAPGSAPTPIAAGLRSPAGFTRAENGDWFYTENQGQWVASGGITHVEPGNFMGHPASLAWSKDPASPVTLSPRDVTGLALPFPEAVRRVPGLKAPAVWLPHTILGISTTDIRQDLTRGTFGPFAGQFFVGDQGQSTLIRVSLEKVAGVYQGAAYLFRGGFDSGIVRLAWGEDGSLFVGSTHRGWGSVGPKSFALERVRWTGRIPFEIQTITAMPDGFRLEFTAPVDAESAANPASYSITGFTYTYHDAYGSPPILQMSCPLIDAVVESPHIVRLVVACLREGFIHEVKAGGVRSGGERTPLLHDTAYYTLNRRPEGIRRTDTAHLVELCDPSVAAPVAALAASSAKRITTRPSHWPASGDITLHLRALPGLKFAPAFAEVPRGARVRLTFENVDDMLHNWLLTAPGRGQEIGAQALLLGLSGAASHFVPDSPAVLAHTSMLPAHAKETVYFTVPENPGDYDYLCSFPGHHTLMKGILRVR